MLENLDILDRRHVDFVTEAMRGGRISLAISDICRADRPDQVFYRECLTRLTDRDGRLHDGRDFVPILDAFGKTPTFDRHVLGLIFSQLEADPHLVLGCDFSADGLFNREACGAVLSFIGNHSHLAPRLVLELTETSTLQGLSFVSGAIADLRAMGCRVALDGFGTGFASPRLIQLIDFDIVKIDRLLLDDNRPSPDGRDSLAHIVNFALSFAPMVVVQGVETKPQIAQASRTGATHFQGDLMSTRLAPHAGSATEATRSA
ncbi:EAL domain-containing protein (plasmid) [Agrobacterium tumefaciens]|nr:EAL domain-containing protein [Agrobacterium tumefaciens]